MLTIQEIEQFIQEDKTSNRKKQAAIGLRYYEAEHDILQYHAYYYNADGELVEDTQRSNIKIPHAFFVELVDQKTQYLLSGEGAFVKTDYPELQAELNKYFDDDFKSEISDLVTYGSVEGFSYMYRHAGEDGRSKFMFADGTGIVEVPSKFASDGKDHIIYYYVDKIEKDKKIECIQDWDDTQTYYYVKEDGKISIDEAKGINPRPHIIYEANSEGEITYDTYGSIPFFRYDNSKSQTSDLKPIKELIDDYDLMNCSLSNNLESPDTIYFVKGMDGENLDQFITNIKTKKALIAPTDGDIEIKTVEIPYEARKVKMDLDEKNIYRFGMGVDTSRVGDGNVTNILIKSRYSLLDLKCNKAELQLRKFLKKILNVVLDEINKANDWDFTEQNVYFDFKRKILTNEYDNAQIEQIKATKKQIEINTLLNLETYLDRELLDQQIADILELEYAEVSDHFRKGIGDEIEEIEGIDSTREIEASDELDELKTTDKQFQEFK